MTTTTTALRVVQSEQTAELLYNYHRREFGARETLARYPDPLDFHRACVQLATSWNAVYDCHFSLVTEEQANDTHQSFVYEVENAQARLEARRPAS